MKVDRRGLLQAMSVGAALAPVLSLNSAVASESDSSGQEVSPGAKFVQMDPNVSFDKQIANNVAPVVLLSTFLVKHEHMEEFLAGFRKQFAIMRKLPGLISAQLHGGVAGSCLFMNYVIWESTDAFNHGFESPEFQAQLKEYPPGTEVLAFMFRRVAVPGMCLGEPLAPDWILQLVRPHPAQAWRKRKDCQSHAE